MNNEQTTDLPSPQRKDLYDELKQIKVYYDKGEDDPQLDIRYRNGPLEIEAEKVFSAEQLVYVSRKLIPLDKPIKFYVRRISFGSCASLEISLLLERRGRRIFRELYFSKGGFDPKTVKFHWKIEPNLKLTLDEWYENWLHDTWR